MKKKDILKQNIYYLLLFIFFCEILYLSYSSYQKKIYKNTLEYYYTSNALNYYQLLKDVHEIFSNEHLEYAIYGGTLLGAIRHQGMIPWDNDIDILMLDYNIPKFLNLIPKIKSLGYQLKEVDFGYKIYRGFHFDYWGLTFCSPSLTVLDIFIMEDKNGKIHLKNQQAKLAYPNDYFLSQELYPLKLYTFGNFTVFGPQKSHDYLARSYSENWNNEAFINFKSKDKIKVILKPQHRAPAYPLGPLLNKN
ncbi:MAG: LicD family protein [Francisellaceae bacterium]|nr:LicD family protein [Francisellaceae bacterium]